MSRRMRLSTGLAPLLLLLAPGTAASQSVDPTLLSDLTYRFIGPDGNRAISVMGEPGNPLVMYVGAASGGLWKTEDGGMSWTSSFDDIEVSSVSAVAMAPSDPNVLWVGTGETFMIRPALAMGDGVYRSTDAGKSWRRMGLERTGRIARLRIDPRDADVVFACALGHSYGPQRERGVYRSRNGGESWELVLQAGEDAGCIDLAMDPQNPRILYAGFWDIQIDTWMLDSGGPESGLWRSTDGGDSWEKLSHSGLGLPSQEGATIGKIAVAVAPSDPDRVYALTEESSPRLYRSDDGGDSWRLTLTNHSIDERAPYYTRIEVDPGNKERIYFVNVRFNMSLDGGRTLVDNPPPGGGDTHDMWIDPLNPARMMVADDGGANFSLNHGESFQRIDLPIAQMYRVSVDDQIPYNVYGNRQDGYSYRGPSNSRTGVIPLGLWKGVGGCESGFSIPEPLDPDHVWAGCYDGGIEVYNHRNGQVRNVRVWPEAGYGWPPAELRYRWHWIVPLLVSRHDGSVYAGSQYVHRTRDRGQSWEIISGDLTRDMEEHQQNSGGVATDNLMTYDGSVLYSLAESPLRQGLLWAGSYDGLVHVSLDGGETWTEVSGNIPGMPRYGSVGSIAPSPHAEGTAYITVDAHQLADFDPYVYRTRDFGETWARIDRGIERSPHSFTHIVAEDPARPGLLFAGTDNAVWASLDDGASWIKLRTNMPPAPVYWLTIQERFGDLVVATYGRGFYILDDLGPLRALTREVTREAVHLFPPRDTYRWVEQMAIHTESSFVNGEDPEPGANIDYWLAREPEGPVEITIEGPSGAVIRTLSGTTKNGLNRVYWDLRHEAPRTPLLRTSPPGATWVQLGPDGTRPLRSWDLDLVRGQMGPRAAPGVYTIRLTVGGEERSAPLTILKDPDSEGGPENIWAQVDFALALRSRLNEVVDLINALEWTRKQMEDIQGTIRDRQAADARTGGGEAAEIDALMAAVHQMEERAIAIESSLYDVHLTGAREDAFRNPMKLYGRFSALASDISGWGADFRPTDQQMEVAALLTERLEAAKAEAESFFGAEIDALNERLQGAGIPLIVGG
ncbi:MAG: glycosyl hydrolase [Gemmatimonadota bacterium]